MKFKSLVVFLKNLNTNSVIQSYTGRQCKDQVGAAAGGWLGSGWHSMFIFNPNLTLILIF